MTNFCEGFSRPSGLTFTEAGELLVASLDLQVNYPKYLPNYPNHLLNYPNHLLNYPKHLLNYPKLPPAGEPLRRPRLAHSRALPRGFLLADQTQQHAAPHPGAKGKHRGRGCTKACYLGLLF